MSWFYKKGKYVFLLFMLSFLYMHFFTQCVPFFFDDHEFHRYYVGQTYWQQFDELLTMGSGNVATGARPVYGIFFKTLYGLIGLDYCGFRFAKTLFFSVFICSFFCIAYLLLRNRLVSFFCALILMTSFPTFLQTFIYDGPHIIAEFFKIWAIIFLILEIKKIKKSFLYLSLIFVFSLLAIRVYSPAYSIVLILPLFLITYNWRKFLKYFPLFILILFIQFPSMINLNPSDVYSAKLINITYFFSNNFLENIFLPLPDYSDLYYKSFTDIVTFFGFWLILVMFVGSFFLRKKEENNRNKPLSKKLIFCLTFSWFISELPAYIFLPEHAIRYMLPLSLPLILFFAFLIMKFLSNLSANYYKFGLLFVFFMISGIIITNISYVYAFRMGWGSSFIGFDNVMDFFSNMDQLGVLYYASSVADEYFPINKSNKNYVFTANIKYLKSGDHNDFNKSSLYDMSKSYSDFYVLKRTSSLSKTQYPSVAIENYAFLNEVGAINGTNSSFIFDKVNNKIVQLLGISYTPNKIVIYQYSALNATF